MNKAIKNTAAYVAAAFLFCVGILLSKGGAAAAAFLTAYIVEYSLSVDNLFVFTLIFSYFAVPGKNQRRVLKWGIIGAVVMRFLMIFTGVKLISSMHWMIYVFGAFLLYLAVKMLSDNGIKVDPAHNYALGFLKKIMPFTDKDSGDSFFAREGGVWKATPLFAALIVIEASDVMFAVDSVPAALAVSRDVFIVYTANIFAVLGLRSLYFLLAEMMGMFGGLKYGIAAVLFFISVKMLISGFYEIPTAIALLVVAVILAASVLASLPHKNNKPQ